MSSIANSNSPLIQVNFLGRREIGELKDLLMPEEQILAAISGYYTAGLALLCVTSRRVLLIDKKIVRLNIEDVRFESIREVNYSHQVFIASLSLYFSGRALQFKTWNRNALKQASQLVQQKIFEMREKLHRNADAEQASALQRIEDDNRSSFAYTSSRLKKRPSFDKYVLDRMRQWQRADMYTRQTLLPLKAGRHILMLELSRH